MNKPFRRAPRRAMAGICAALLATAGFSAVPAGATAVVTTTRLSGATRYDTAAALAKAAYPGTTNDVVLASGEGFADALAASALAGKLNAPILTTPKDSLHSAAANALGQFKPTLGKVWILGGTAALSQAVQDAVAALGYPTQRVAGADRYETAKLIGDQVGAANVGTLSGKKVAVVATGTGFADALAIGPAAFRMKFPVLLTTPDSLHAMTSAGLTALGIGRVILLGGTGAVSDAVKTAIEAMPGAITVTRIGGANRNDTAAKVADALTKDPLAGGLGTNAAFTGVNVGLASGVDAKGGVDALAAAPYLGGTTLPGGTAATLLLTGSVPPETSAWLSTNKATVANLFAAGGTATISDADLTELKTAATVVAPTATITAVQGGTRYSVTFSEAMNPASAAAVANFKVDGANAAAAVYDASTKTTLVTPAAALTVGQTILVSGAATPDGRVVANTTLTIVADTTKPAVATIFAAADATTAYVKFNEQMSVAGGGSAASALNYSSTGAGGVTGSAANAGAIPNTSFQLTLGGALVPGNVITVLATVADAAGNTLPTAISYTVGTDTVAPTITSAVGTLVPTAQAVVALAAVGNVGISVVAKSTGSAAGVLGNGWTFQIGAATPAVVVTVNSAVSPKTILVTAPAGTTQQQLVDALNANASFNSSFTAQTTVPAGNAMVAEGPTALAGGTSQHTLVITYSELMVAGAGLVAAYTAPAAGIDPDGAGATAAFTAGGVAVVANDTLAPTSVVLVTNIVAVANVPQPGVATITATGLFDYQNGATAAPGAPIALSPANKVIS